MSSRIHHLSFVFAALTVLPAVLASAAQPPEMHTVHKIDIKAQHPRAYHPAVGDVLQFYVRYAVTSDQIVQDLKFSIKGEQLARIGVINTTKPHIVGAGELSAFLLVKDKGLAHVEFEAIPGHTQQPTRIAVLAEGGAAQVGREGGNDTESNDLDATALVKLLKPVSVGGGELPLEVQFQLPGKTDQGFASPEYRFAVLNKDGVQVKDAVVFRPVYEWIELPKEARSITHRPQVALVGGKLTAGADYYLVVSVRNLVGLTEFKATQ
jgi:hypothetical protein